MKGIWVFPLLFLLAACAPGMDLQKLADENPDSVIAVNKLSGNDAELFLSSLKQFCPDATGDPIYRVQIIQQEKTITRAINNRQTICEVDSSDENYAEKSVAVLVNGEAITLADIQSALESVPQDLQAQAIGNIINALISQELLNQEAKKRGVTGAELSNELSGEITVTDEEIRAYYEDNPEQMIMPDTWNVRHIQINFDDKDEESTLKKAQSVVTLLATTDFCDLAEQFSDDASTASDCGKSTFVTGQLVGPIQDALDEMQPGEVRLVKTETGFHILVLDSKEPSKKAEYSEVKESIEQMISLQKRQTAFNDFLSQIREDAEIVSYLI